MSNVWNHAMCYIKTAVTMITLPPLWSARWMGKIAWVASPPPPDFRCCLRPCRWWKAAWWSYTGAVEERPMSCAGRHMPQHLRYVVRPCQEYTGWVCSAGGRTKQERQVCGHHRWSTLFLSSSKPRSGVWGEQALVLVTEVGRRMAEVNKEPRSTTFLRQRLSVAVQRGSAVCILTVRSKNI